VITKLFELEIPEIAEKTVVIKSIAREPGHRTKIAVASNDKRIDCVGACVGMRGARVKNIVRELNGEKIDIIRYDDNTENYIKEALSPSTPVKIELEEESNLAIVVVRDEEYSLAIGKQGQNARLTSKLIGWKIDIVNETRYEKKGHKLVERLMDIPGIDKKMAEDLSKAGFLSLEEIADAEVPRLTEIEGLGELTAMKIQELIRMSLEAEALRANEMAREMHEAPAEETGEPVEDAQEAESPADEDADEGAPNEDMSAPEEPEEPVEEPNKETSGE
jgi:N utilization substance protein A